MKKYDFVTLKLFVAISDTGQLSAAAEREHLALAAVSKRVSDLESMIGSKLFYRQPRGVELTPAGQAFLYHARRILDDISRLDADISDFSEGIKGHVRIHSNTSAVIAFLPQNLSAFSLEHPQIKIDLQERTSNEVITAVQDGQADIGIFAGHVPAEGLETYPYKSDQLMLVLPLDHPMASRETVSLQEVIGLDFVGLQQDTSLHSLLQEQAVQAGHSLRMRIQVRSFDAICRMIHHGMGIGILPERTLYRDIGDLAITSIPLSDKWAKRELVIGIRQHKFLSAIARQLVDHLLEC